MVSYKDDDCRTNCPDVATVRQLRKALRECMRYVECTDGFQGDLVGCAVNKPDFTKWEELSRVYD